MKKSATGEKTSLLKWAEERMKLKPELEEEKRKQQTSKEPRDSSLVAVPYLPDGLHFPHHCPASSLNRYYHRGLFVRPGTGLFNRPDFVDSPSSAIKRWIDIFDPRLRGLPHSVAVLHWHLFSPRTRRRANGLIILEKVVKGRGLIVMNPVTREVEEVPLGTMCDPHRALPNVDHNEHIVSMPLKDEKFVKIPLPSTGGIHDRVLEIGGSLGFVSPQPGCYFPHVNSLVSWKILQDENKIGVTNS
ncbi:hypothetical protein SASPL_148007 [Salvia splendens]|uniref:Uncharacterized protein n=1 Tax=Salvia splendens TaxID=180675 RepID=A0A8X8W910_SALSN|nr:hypothetical protein SASPL_148007 [Salvia splendens]